jgi:hypothetical protein
MRIIFFGLVALAALSSAFYENNSAVLSLNDQNFDSKLAESEVGHG